MLKKRIFKVGICVLALIVIGLLFCRCTYLVYSFRNISQDADYLDNAKFFIHLFESDMKSEKTLFLESRHPKDTCCTVSVIAFNPAWTSFRVNHLVIYVDGTNAADITKPSTIDTNDLVFKPYIDTERFRSEFPNIDPREASFAFFPEPTTEPMLACPPNINSKIQVQVNVDILLADQSVFSTNIHADFALRKEEVRYSLAEKYFMMMFMPRF